MFVCLHCMSVLMVCVSTFYVCSDGLCLQCMSVLMVCVSILYVCPDGLSNGHEKLKPVPENEARMVLRLKHISRLSNYLFTKLAPISRYCDFIPDVCPPNSCMQFIGNL